MLTIALRLFTYWVHNHLIKQFEKQIQSYVGTPVLSWAIQYSFEICPTLLHIVENMESMRKKATVRILCANKCMLSRETNPLN